MLERVLEPEVMNTPDEARDYDQMDHSEVNRRFVDDFLAFSGWPAIPDGGQVLDSGTGTAQIPIVLADRIAGGTIVAVDLADEMLKMARANVAAAGHLERIQLVLADGKSLPFADGTFAAVISNSIIHHIPEPRVALAEMVRVLRPRGVLFIRDLCRPVDQEEWARLVQLYAGAANPHQRQMFADSLHAALTVAEIQQLVSAWGIPTSAVTMTSDRHWTLAWQAP